MLLTRIIFMCSLDSGAVYTLALKTHVGMSIDTWRYFAGWCDKVSRVACPNSEHPALTSSFKKYKFLQMKNSFATIANGLSVLKLFQLSIGDLLFSYHAYSIYKVRKPRITKLGLGIRS